MSTLSPRLVARAMGVSESSLKRWCDQGLIAAARTAGGHRRLESESVLAFLQQSGRTLTDPALLRLKDNLPPTTNIDDLVAPFEEALVAGREDECRLILLGLHARGESIARIGDGLIAPVFSGIGLACSAGETGIYHERRAGVICERVLAELRRMLTDAPATAPLAIGAAPAGDLYSLPTHLVDLTLREAGWRTQLLGDNLPFDALSDAVADLRPALFWLSVSHVIDETAFLRGYVSFQQGLPADVSIVVGGRGLHAGLRRQMDYASYCDNLRQLTSFVRSLGRSVSESPRATGNRP